MGKGMEKRIRKNREIAMATRSRNSTERMRG